MMDKEERPPIYPAEWLTEDPGFRYEEHWNAEMSERKIELVKEPFVCAVASTQFDPDAIEHFVRSHGLERAAQPYQDTPIARIANRAYKSDSHLDLLAEFSGRFCYRSWTKGRESADYIENVLKERHGSVFAHGHVSFVVTGVSRSLTHELIRHHVGTAVSQESQRYVIADGEIAVLGVEPARAVVPPMILRLSETTPGAYLRDFERQFELALVAYQSWRKALLDEAGATAKRATEAARALLPNCVETRLVWTMNMRAARNVIEQRGSESADLEIRRLAVAFTHELKKIAPLTFKDADVYTAADGFEAVKVQHSKV